MLVIIMISVATAPMGFGNTGVRSVPTQPLLIVGDDIDYPPYSYLDSEGNPAGFNVELARLVGETMGYRVEIRLDEWSKVRASLEDGTVDVISGMFYSSEREKIYSFSSKHSITSGAIFSRGENPIRSLEELRGKTVVVQKGDIVGEFLASQRMDITLIVVPTVAEALTLVNRGDYDYAGVLKLPGLYAIKKEKLKRVKLQSPVFTPNEYCMAVRKGNEDLLLILNAGLQIAKATGDYQRIYDSWLGVYEEKTIATLFSAYWWVFLSGGIGMLVLWAWILSLRHQVKLRTSELLRVNDKLLEQQEELAASNEEIEASLEELTATEQELREHFERLLSSESRLKASEERNRSIIEALPDIFFILDSEGRYIDCHSGHETELLLPREELVGKSIKDVMPAAVAARGLEKIRKALETGEIQHFEYELELPAGPSYFEMRISRSFENEVIGISRNITRRKQYQHRIEYLSYHDQLTGLYNRRFFEEELARLDVPRNLPLCIIMADVNGLKLINDSFGHRMGDELLTKVAQIMKNACRADELIFRVGGDEFVILLPDFSEEYAEVLIARIKAACDKETVGAVGISVSYGWEAKRVPEEDVYEVFNRAEDHMYKKKLFEGPSMRGKTIGAIINTLHEKNKREERHSKRVAYIARHFATILSMQEKDVDEVEHAALLHDIGKIAIHEYLLNKPGPLTPDELEEVRRHPEIGYRILSSVNDMADMAEYVLSHHERWDGLGYPRGISGSTIPVQARIIAIADAFDAMTAERSYRKAVSFQEAVEEIRRNGGSQFDPDLAELFAQKVSQDDRFCSDIQQMTYY